MFAPPSLSLSGGKRRRPRRQLRHGALRRHRRLQRACGGQPRRPFRVFREAQQVTVPPLAPGMPPARDLRAGLFWILFG